MVNVGEHTQVACVTYTMATWDLPDIYAHTLGPSSPWAWVRQIPHSHDGITIIYDSHSYSYFSLYSVPCPPLTDPKNGTITCSLGDDPMKTFIVSHVTLVLS